VTRNNGGGARDFKLHDDVGAALSRKAHELEGQLDWNSMVRVPFENFSQKFLIFSAAFCPLPSTTVQRNPFLCRYQWIGDVCRETTLPGA
jgi:hypothetical protein